MRFLLTLIWVWCAHDLFAQIPVDSLKAYYPFSASLSDASGNGNHIVNGSGTFVNDRFGNPLGALSLNGLTDSLTIPIPEFSPVSGDFTISFWFKTNHPEVMNCFSSKEFPDDTTNNFEIQLNSHNRYYLQNYMQTFYETFVYWNGTGMDTNAIAEGGPGEFTKGDWCHFVLQRETDTFRIFFNHIIHTLSIDNHFSGMLGDAVDLIFSASPYRFKGVIDDLRLYNRNLSQAEIDLLWFENNPFCFTTVKATDAYVHGSNVLVYWEYDASQVSDSIQVEYRINGGSWQNALHSNMAYENYTYVDMSYPAGTEVEVRVTDLNNPQLTASTGAFMQSEYNWMEVSDSLPFHAMDGAGLLNYQGKMWLLGGWDPPYHPPLYTHSDVYSSTDGVNWNFETTAPWPARHCGCWLVSDSAMWVLGGDPQSGCLTDVWRSTDGINWVQTTSAIPGYLPRNNANYAFLNGELFLYGGEQCSGTGLNDVWSSSDGVNWNNLGNAPWAGRGMQINSCVDDSGKLWMLSGSNEGTRRCYNDVWNTNDGINWTLVNESAPWKGRLWHTVAWFDQKIWLLGGLATAYEMNDVWYSGDGITWHELKTTTGIVPAGTRHAQSTTVFNNALWYMCGINTNNAWKIYNSSQVTGIDTVLQALSVFQMFPNPSDDYLQISNASQISGYEIFQFDGKFIGHGHSFPINISQLSSGLYFLRIRTKTNKETIQKFIKQ